MTTYTVYMVNFNMTKGTFNTAQEAINQAKALGFECAIYATEPDGENRLYTYVRPY